MKKEKINMKDLINKFIDTVKKMIEYLKKVDFKRKMKLIGEIIVIILLLCLLKLPFSVVRDLIINAFFSVKITSEILMNIIYLLFEIPYLSLIIYLFIKTIVTRYENLKVEENTQIVNQEAVNEVEISLLANQKNEGEQQNIEKNSQS